MLVHELSCRATLYNSATWLLAANKVFTASLLMPIIISISRHIYLYIGMDLPDSEIERVFNAEREPYTPYGTTCKLAILACIVTHRQSLTIGITHHWNYG